MLITEAGKSTQRNSGVSNYYTIIHAHFEGVELYAAKRYVNLIKEGTNEELLSIINSKKKMKLCQFLIHL